jgi:hypothetical protein
LRIVVPSHAVPRSSSTYWSIGSSIERTLPSSTAMPTTAEMNDFVTDHGWWRTSLDHPLA